MLLDFVAVGMVALFVSLGVYGVLLMRQSGRRRVAGGVLVAESLLLLGTFVFLTTFPFGIGEPLIRVRLEETLLLTAIGLAAVAAAIAVVYAGARVFLRRRARVSGSGPAVAGLLIILPLLAFVCFYALARISLPEREREVVQLRYGLAGTDPTPLREIGRRPGLTVGIEGLLGL